MRSGLIGDGSEMEVGQPLGRRHPVDVAGRKVNRGTSAWAAGCSHRILGRAASGVVIVSAISSPALGMRRRIGYLSDLTEAGK
jgi:hypothetical protein